MAEEKCKSCKHEKSKHKIVTDGGRRKTKCTGGAPIKDPNDRYTVNLNNSSMPCTCQGFVAVSK